ncbi:flavoprotein [Rhodococcoides corynebacterioides]|uniref:flavoprotein n=1 Tax=Rhodococcoides corynebacterioides TaxID=53972 RepID=UPI001C9B9EB0|nr:flavoprotein [Rhodococcus corynebacterioides]MBY6350959.1 flavoprotein [Rhodococcus corynebacterioides]
MTAAAPIPATASERLLLIATGSIASADLPFWVQWLADSYPDLQTTVVLTRSALRFVTPQALRCRPRTTVVIDEWAADDDAVHVDWAEWADGVVVFPAGLDYLSRYANGLAGSPSLMALHCTRAPVVFAPALPPGAVTSAAFERVLAVVAEHPGVGVLPTRAGVSSTTGKTYTGVVALFPDAIELLEERRTELRP